MHIMANRLGMASSSQPPKKYDVFISFRGEDTRLSFTSHLHSSLRIDQATYIDDRLEKGEEVWPSLEKAIEDSTLFLVIFSENYASSTWCLRELTKILECSKNEGHHVMPVFYRVDPSHVRKQSGSYQKALEKHENNRSINKQQLQKWREALTHAADLSGWHCSSNSNEAELIAKIVQCVKRKLYLRYPSEDNVKGLIGIHKRMTDLESLLNKDSKGVQCVAIWGMGGMGKTTLARALSDKLCSAYDGVCFMGNISEKLKKKGIYALKKKLILELLGESMLAEIPHYAMKALRRKRIFIVLDDVDDPAQLEDLAGRHDWFGSGSKILITTRDKQVVLGKEVDDIYRVEALNPAEAFDLFSIKTFRNNYADPNIRELAKKVTQYADGNPLALNLLGSLLNGKSYEAWESQLKKIQKLPCKRINDILKLSFKGLEDDEEKNIFLHIVCFFNQYDVKDVTNWLDACGYLTVIALERLKDKALLDIQRERICMHHLIKEMGRDIVRKKSYPQMRVLMWNSNDTGSEAIEGICLDASEVLEEMCLNPQVFSSMPKLRFLIFHDDLRENKLKFPCGIEFLPNKLILLCWKGYPLKSLPATFTGEHLVKIQMCDSKLTKLWDGEQNVVNLREIDLSGSQELIELTNFNKAIHLECVNLEWCLKLRRVDPSILSLHSLHWLSLEQCEALTSLTSNTHLKSLQYLNLIGCSGLRKFSVTSKNRNFHLFVVGTAIDGELCSSSGRLSKINYLYLGGSESLTILPHKLFDLRSLQHLSANGCNKVASNLHSILDEMRALSVLELRDYSELFEVPDSIGMLSSLWTLDLSRSNIETLPSSIKHCSRLRYIYLDGCKRLYSLPQLPSSFSVFTTDDCVSLETLHLSHIHNCLHEQCYFSFKNCVKLDGQSINAAEVNLLLLESNLKKDIRLDYPGERVLEWFMYRSHQSPQTVDLPCIPQPWDGTFIFCAIISKSRTSFHDKLYAECLIDGQHVCTCQTELSFGPLMSDHVILWSDKYHPSGEVQRKIEEKKRESQDNTYHPLLQIRFIPSRDSESDVKIKECGAFPTSSLQYQNYIQHLQLALQLRNHLENANIAALMSLENLIPSLKAIMTLKNLILSFKVLMILKNSRRSLKALRNLKSLILCLEALMDLITSLKALKNLIPSLKALRNLKNLILCLEALVNLKSLIPNLKNLTMLERYDEVEEFGSFDESCEDESESSYESCEDESGSSDESCEDE